MTKRIIRRRIFMGDSLSDRGTLDHLKLLDFIPMSLVSGLDGKSPRGRFTNGFLWADMLGASRSEQLEIDHWRHTLKLPDTPSADADLADLILSDTRLIEQNEKAFTLDDDKNILFQGARFIRSYCEGGATAADWKEKLILSPAEEGARLIVSHLAAKRKQLFADDFIYKVSDKEKEETLVTEWSGANDLITVNTQPDKQAADRAVTARIANLEAMIRNGYKNFVLMNLPDLSLSPRYQAKSAAEQANAKECSAYFNQQLAAQVEKLKKKYGSQNVFIDVFDVYGLLTEVYNAPEQYGFDKDKLRAPYTSSEQFKQNASDPADQAQKISPADGYMFWDDVHPTATMHAWLAEKYMDKYDSTFSYKSPTTHSESCAVKRAIRKVEETYGLDVSAELEARAHTHHTIPAPSSRIAVNKAVDSIKQYVQKLQGKCFSNEIAKEKAEALAELLVKIEKSWSTVNLEALNEVLNANVDNAKFAAHQNPRWDAFWKKETTRTENLLRDLQLAVNEALNHPLEEEQSLNPH